MTETSTSLARGTRPVVVTTAAVLAIASPVLSVGLLVDYLQMLGDLGLLDQVALVAQLIAAPAAYVVTGVGILRSRDWARIGFTALAVVALLGQTPQLLLIVVGEGASEPELLLHFLAHAALLAAAALLWTAPSRAWFGPLR